MKPFNLQDAIAGKPLITRCGYRARHLASPPETKHQAYPHCFIVTDSNERSFVTSYTSNGRTYYDDVEHELDLFMRPDKRKVYCALVQVASRGVYVTTSADKETLQARLRETKYQKVFQTFELEYEL